MSQTINTKENEITVIDNLLSDFEDYNKRVDFVRFETLSQQGVHYNDMSQDLSGDRIYEAIKKLTDINPDNQLNFLRAYRKRSEPNPTWIHSDAFFADYIAIFMVRSSSEPQDDGVCFWKNKGLNSICIDESNRPMWDTINKQSLDADKWELWKRIEFKENRLIIAPAAYFHSKTTYSNRGNSFQDCRIVHVLFFNKGE